MSDTVCTSLAAYVYETDAGGVTYLARCIPKPGVFLYRVLATYAKQHPSVSYYVLGTSEKDARQRFLRRHAPVLYITGVELIDPGPEAEAILTNLNTIPQFY